MSRKIKVEPEDKIRAVEDYLKGSGSQGAISRKYSIHKKTFQAWIRKYQSQGTAGLIPAATNHKYPVELKRNAVQEYNSGKGSLNDICKKYGISEEALLRNWIKAYNSHGDFKQPNSGSETYMAKGRETGLDERIEIVSYCIANNKDYGKTIEKYGVSYQQIYSWVRKYEQGGPDSLVDRRGKRKDEASMTEVEKLRAQLKLKEAENLRLQMENDLLKKLEALERGLDKG
jgi:transposase-like protein